MSKRCLLPLLAAVVLLVSACGGGEEAAKKMTIAVIPKGATHEFWKAIHAGAVKAQRELAAQGTEIELIWKGPLKEDDREQQVQVVENFIGRRVSGIVLAPLDADALVAPVEAAGRASIPVVIIDSDLNTPQRLSYIATDNYQGGRLAGERLAEVLGGRGKAILLRFQVGSASTEAREKGFLDVLAQHPGIELISSDQHAGATRETAYQASQNLLNRFGRDVQAIFTPNETSTVGMLLALRDIGRAGGAVKLIGFDAGAQSIEALQNGDIQGLVVQNPMRMGYEGVMTMVRHLQMESVDPMLDTGVILVTPENAGAAEVQSLLHPPVSEYLDE